MALPRFVLPELLDRMSADDPAALDIRRDLQKINGLLPNARVMAQQLRQHCGPTAPRVILDIGGGDASFMLRVARRLAPQWKGVTVRVLDRHDAIDRDTREQFATLSWSVEAVVSDVFAYFEQPDAPTADVVTANLFLHQFERDDVARLLACAARAASLVVACEPRRAKLALRLTQMLWVIGCNDLCCHDAVTSVWAGFRERELSALWPDAKGWTLHERTVWPFIQVFAARREGVTTAD